MLVSLTGRPAGSVPGVERPLSRSRSTASASTSRFVPSSPYVSYALYADEAQRPEVRADNRAGAERSVGQDRTGRSTRPCVRKFILSYRKFDGQFATDADQTPINEQTVDGRQNFQSRTAELRFSGRVFDKVDWTSGVVLSEPRRFHSVRRSAFPRSSSRAPMRGRDCCPAQTRCRRPEAGACGDHRWAGAIPRQRQQPARSRRTSRSFAHSGHRISTDKLSMTLGAALFEGRQGRAVRQHHRHARRWAHRRTASTGRPASTTSSPTRCSDTFRRRRVIARSPSIRARSSARSS